MIKIKKLIANIIVSILIIMMLASSFSYAKAPPVSQEDAGKAMGGFAINMVSNHSDDVEYSDDPSTISNVLVQENIVMNETVWADFVCANSLGTPAPNAISSYFENVITGNPLSKEQLKSKLKVGDVLVSTDDKTYGIVCGESCDRVVYCAKPSSDKESCLKLKRLDIYNETIKDEDKDLYCTLQWKSVLRIKEEVANQLEAGNVTTLLEKDREEDDEEYSNYYGTTEGRYVGSYNIISWLFSQFLGFMDYLFGIIAYILRAPFVGWANIIENMINDTINNLSGVQLTEDGKVSDTTTDNEDDDTKSRTLNTPKDTDIYVTKRINIEDIIFNKVPLLDVNFFELKEQLEVADSTNNGNNATINPQPMNNEKLEQTLGNYQKTSSGIISKDSIVFKLRENIAVWYVSMRNIAIVAMVIILVYCGIRLAVTSIGEKKAKYKEVLFGWLISLIMIFAVHYFMVLVIEMNQTLLDLFYKQLGNANQMYNGGLSLYDTVRTRAYSFKLSEGVPATIIYMFLIYYLIRFLVVYIKRYFTVCILALMGPIMCVKAAFDKAKTGKSSSFTSWMFDFALNVLLQSVHAIIYTILMTTAFKLALTSISGFVLALVLLNFIFKADKIFMTIFKFNKRAGTLGDVVDGVEPGGKKPKNYLLEGYQISRGIALYSGAFARFGFGLVKNTTKIVTQPFISISNIARWEQQKEQAIANGEEIPEYKPISIEDKIKDRAPRWLKKLEKTNPELYKAAKQTLERNRKLKREVMKRSLKNGAMSVKAMASFMAGIPIAIATPGVGIAMLSSSLRQMNNMAKDKPYYGHQTKKQIRGRRGRMAARILVGTEYLGYKTAKTGIEQLAKAKKVIAKNESMIADTRKLELIQDNIDKQLMILEAEMQKEAKDDENKEKEYRKRIAKNINSALDSVLNSKDIKGVVKSYMIKNDVNKLSDYDVQIIMRELNIANIDKELSKLESSESAAINEIKDKLDKINTTISQTRRPDEKSKQESIKKELQHELKEKEIIKEITAKVGKELLKSESINDGILREDTVDTAIKEYVKDKNISVDSLSDKDVKPIVDMFDKKVKAKQTLASKEVVKEKADEKKKNGSSGLDRKQTVDAILDAILQDGKPKEMEKEENQQIQYLADLMREAKTLNEKSKNERGKSIVNMKELTNKAKGKKK